MAGEVDCLILCDCLLSSNKCGLFDENDTTSVGGCRLEASLGESGGLAVFRGNSIGEDRGLRGDCG